MTTSSTSSPGAAGPDRSVRVAWADDAAALADLQLRAWPVLYADLVPAEALPSGEADRERARATWAQVLSRPADARQRVLVALERDRVGGYAVLAPAGDPDCDPVRDGELVELVVDPAQARQGHGSRLLQACADTLRADRFVRAVRWVNATDDASLAFLRGAGWEADTAHRELDLDGSGAVRVRQVRLHTALT